MKKTLFVLFLIPFVLWTLVGVPGIVENPGFWTYRNSIVMLSGILTLLWMGLAVLLATRASYLEEKIGGLDKMYFLHKWIGIGAGVFVFIHWLAEQGVKKAGKWGLFQFPPRVRGPKPEMSEWWATMREIGSFLGEWAGYIAFALVLIALIKRFSYRSFRITHKIFPVIFLMGAFHGLVYMPDHYWTSPIAWLTAVVSAVAIVVSLWILAGKLGKNKQTQATIQSIEKGQDGTLSVTVRAENWAGHQAGQFLFIHFGDKMEGAHPFTIASAWNKDEKTLRLGIKPLGDYTKQLSTLIQAGQSVRLEGPYGDFQFADSTDPQVWVAGGVGITPFIARLNDLAFKKQSLNNVDFFCSQRNENAHFMDEIKNLSQKTGVRLHLWFSDKSGALPQENISAVCNNQSKVWFCGPFMWGESLLKHLESKGVSPKNFHRERFEFR